jgi:hypothetical protein
MGPRLRRSLLTVALVALAFGTTTSVHSRSPSTFWPPRPAAACVPDGSVPVGFAGEGIAGRCLGGAIGAVVGAAGQAAKANRAQAAAQAACSPIAAANVLSLVQAGVAVIGTSQRIKWSAGSDAFWTIGQKEIARYDAATLQRTVVQSGTANVLDFSPDSGLVALTSNQLTVQLRDVRTQTDKGTITPSGPFGSVALSPDGSLVAVGLLSAIAEELRSTTGGSLLRTYTGFSTGAPVYSASFAPDGASLIWLARARVQQMLLANGVFGPPFEHEDFVLDISITSTRLATAFGEGDRVWDLTSGAKLSDFRPANGGLSAVLTRDGAMVFVGNKSEIDVFDTTTGAALATITRPGTTLALSPDGCTLLATSFEGTLAALKASAPALSPIAAIRAPATGDGGLGDARFCASDLSLGQAVNQWLSP